MLANMLRAASLGASTNVQLVRDLQSRSEVLRGISRRFVEIGAELQILSFWETERFGWSGAKIVEEDSATLGWPSETTIPVEGDHRTICHFGSVDERRYRCVWANLKILAGEAVGNGKLMLRFYSAGMLRADGSFHRLDGGRKDNALISVYF